MFSALDMQELAQVHNVKVSSSDVSGGADKSTDMLYFYIVIFVESLLNNRFFLSYSVV